MSEQWRDQALCQSRDPELFFPERSNSTRANKEAKQVCHACEVERECLTYALEADVDGVWGGTSPRERDRLRRELNKGRRAGVRGSKFRKGAA